MHRGIKFQFIRYLHIIYKFISTAKRDCVKRAEQQNSKEIKRRSKSVPASSRNIVQDHRDDPKPCIVLDRKFVSEYLHQREEKQKQTKSPEPNDLIDLVSNVSIISPDSSVEFVSETKPKPRPNDVAALNLTSDWKPMSGLYKKSFWGNKKMSNIWQIG